MEIVKLKSIEPQLRRAAKKINALQELISKLEVGEALVISAKEADRWKYPAHSLRSTIDLGYKSKMINKSVKYSVNHLKSGSYAIIRSNK